MSLMSTFIKKYLADDEQILDSMDAMFTGTALGGKKTARKGVVVVTNKRLVTYVKSLVLGEYLGEYDFFNIVRVEMDSNLTSCTILITGQGFSDLQITETSVFSTKRGPAIASLIKEQIAKAQNAHKQTAAATPVTNDTIGQLERLAKLREQGILTDEEFNSQKAKILNM